MTEKPYLGVKVEGLNRLRYTLRAAGSDMKDLKELNRRAAKVVSDEAIASAPVGDDYKGHIKNTIRPGAGVVRVGNAKLPYGNFIHWNNKTNNYRGNPWLSIAGQKTEPIWVAFYFKELEQIINKVSGDL